MKTLKYLMCAVLTFSYDKNAQAMNAEGGGGSPAHAFPFSAGGGGGGAIGSRNSADLGQAAKNDTALRTTYAVGLAEDDAKSNELQATFDMTSRSKRERWDYPYKGFLFGHSKPEENYGLMTPLSFYLTYLDWSRQQGQRTTPGFLGLQHGLPYDTMSRADIARFKSDAEAAFGNGYVSYTGIVKPDAGGEAEHFWALLAIKGEDKQIKALYLLNPSFRNDTIRDNAPLDTSYVKIIDKLRSSGLPIDDNKSFYVGVQGGNMACGLAATMIARYFSTLKASDIATDEMVLEQIMALKRSCCYGDSPLQKPTFVDQKLISDETDFGNAIVRIFDELYDITTSGGLSFPQTVKQWLTTNSNPQTVKQWLTTNSNAVLPAVIEERNAAQPLARAESGGASAGGGGISQHLHAGEQRPAAALEEQRRATEQAANRQRAEEERRAGGGGGGGDSA